MSKLTGLGGRLYTGETSIDIIGKKKRWYAFSGLLVALSFGALTLQGLHLGIEFKGGASYTVTKSGADLNPALEAITKAGIPGEPIVQSVGNDKGRIQTGSLSNAQSTALQDALSANYGVSVDSIDTQIIGPSWGKEITRKALYGLIGFIILALIASKLLPYLLRTIRWESDLFLIYSVAIGLSIAALGTVVFGIPMALASFVAGLAINQNRDTDDVRKAVLPFRDLFQVLFFVVIGSLVQPELILDALPFAAILLAMMLGLKTLPAYIFARIGKIGDSYSQLAIGLSQVGEFSFVLGSTALAAGVLEQEQFTAMLLAVIASIIISTLAVRRSNRVSRSI